MFTVDRDECIGCGFCAADCFPGAIAMDGGYPSLKDPEACILCGHCVAICPQDAVSLPQLPMDDVCTPSPERRRLQPEHLLEALRFRRTVRRFRPEPVEEEKIVRMIEAARAFPTARNLQQTEYIVVRDPERIARLRSMGLAHLAESGRGMLGMDGPDMARMGEKLIRMQEEHLADPGGSDKLFFFAPLLIFSAAPSSLRADAFAASAVMELMAGAQGLGMLYSGYFASVAEKPDIRAELQLRDGLRIARCMVVGYPAVEYCRSAPRKKPSVTWL